MMNDFKPGQNRTELMVNPDLCIGCGLCAEICPLGAISIRSGLAQIDPKKCNRCCYCAGACPQKAIIDRIPVSKNELEATISSLKQHADGLVSRIESLKK